MNIPRKYAAIGMCSVLAAAAPVALAAEAAGNAASAEALFAARVNALRQASSQDAAAFSGFLSASHQADGEAVRRAWNDVVTDIPSAQLRDFFAGANVLAGPVSQQQGKTAWSGVLGLYNPWWDAILVLRLGDDLRIDRLALLGGEAFRGEELGQAPSTSTVIPVAEPLSQAVLRVQSKTMARFRELYPKGSAANAGRIPPRGVSRELAAVKTRAALRQRLMQAFVASGKNDGGLATVAARAQDALRHGDADSLKRLFADSTRFAFCDTFTEIPAEIREGFSLYGFLTGGNGSLFVFLNPAMPNLYASVTFPAGRETNPGAGNVIFEWFDLANADKLLEVTKGKDISR